MHFIDLYLRGPDKAAVDAALEAAGLTERIQTPEGETVQPKPGIAVDEIGIIMKDEAPLPGWHVNVWTANDITFEQREILNAVLIPTPVTPHRQRA